MLAYSTIGTNDMERARKFYGELLSEVGAKEVLVRPDGGFVAYGAKQGEPMFAVATPYDGNPATVGNGTMIAIAAKDPAQVKSLYEKAMALGATDEGEPGPRLDGFCSCGYVRDPDGNKLNFFCMGS